MKHHHPHALIILDGFGYSQETEYNAIYHAHTPTLDLWKATYPHSLCQASGKAVGLLNNYCGNSLVGHLTIGSGRVIEQPVATLDAAVDKGTLFNNELLNEALSSLALRTKKLHIMGLLSDAGVHSHTKHLYAFIAAAQHQKIDTIVIHPFLDGRDVAPQSALSYLQELEQQLTPDNNQFIGSIHGRMYAMDRDGNWDRTMQSYATLTQQQTTQTLSWRNVINNSYTHNTFDEFIPPTQLHPDAFIQDDDGIIFFNFRPDRARQLASLFFSQTTPFVHNPIPHFSFFITPFLYGNNIPTTPLFYWPTVEHTLLETIARHKQSLFTIAETEKYAHVTYFFNGGKEQQLANEKRVLIPSLPLKNYVNHPKMSAPTITKTILDSLTNNPADFYLINYANADMVGHSGDFNATVQAIECLDQQLKAVYTEIVEKRQGTLYVTADHGNAESMYDPETKQPKTSHTTNSVPFYYITHNKQQSIQLPTRLSSVAAFILKTMNIPIPQEMDQE